MNSQIVVLLLKLEPRRVYRPVVAVTYHFDEEQDPDRDRH